jgi:hypothetical protein
MKNNFGKNTENNISPEKDEKEKIIALVFVVLKWYR